MKFTPDFPVFRPERDSLINRRLEPEAFRVIQEKATERAFTGEFWDHHGEGQYVCRRCRGPLYRSGDKFDSRCGWPSFDDELPGAVVRKPDADGLRTEILCASCGAHLGHVFTGERMTPKNTRHCVNSLSLRFVPDRGETGRGVFAGGCFWGVEYLFRKKAGVLSAVSGYTGGHKAFPSYREVCDGGTGHLEAVEVLYDPGKVSFRDLAMYFLEIHDPEQTDGQGPDRGGQYLSAVFCENPEQEETVRELLEILRGKGYRPATDLRPTAPFWPAEDYHQDYYSGNGKQPYCHRHTPRF